MNHAWTVLAALAFVTVTGCARAAPAMQSDGAPPSPAPAPSAPSTATPLLAPLSGEWMQEVELTKGRHATFALPLGAREKRAIVVGVHGAGDRADWACSEWQAVTAGWAFVVCPQGVTHPTDRSAFVWGSRGRSPPRPRKR